MLLGSIWESDTLLWKKYSTFHALINITQNMIGKSLDHGNMGCEVFIVDFLLNHYGIYGVSDDWFKTYLSNCNQYVFIKGYGSGSAAINKSLKDLF